MNWFKKDNKETVVQSNHSSTGGVSSLGVSVTTMLENISPDADGSANHGGVGYEVNSFRVPLLGRGTAERHQRVLSILLILGLAFLAGVIFWVMRGTNDVAQQVAATGRAMMQSQKLAKSVSRAVLGDTKAFTKIKESSNDLKSAIDSLKQRNSGTFSAVGHRALDGLAQILPLVDRTNKNTQTILEHEPILAQVSTSLHDINVNSAELLTIAENLASLKLQANAPAVEMSVVGNLVMLTQRISKSANESLTFDGVNPEAIFLLGKDLNSFKELAEGLLNGNVDLRLSPARDDRVRIGLQDLLRAYEKTRENASGLLGNLQGLVAVREAENSIVADNEPLRKNLEALESQLSSAAGLRPEHLLGVVLSGLLALASVAGLGFVQLRESQYRQSLAEEQRHLAELQQQESKRVNDANQAVILRLMNELQTVAEGDLTQEATVTEDITGAIADSVNYTVEELRALVGNVQSTATRVAQTTGKVENTSNDLLTASTKQLCQIRETGQSVLDMAARINGVSTQAQESAAVARQSRQAAESSLTAVQNAIGGMNTIRDQIQETSKRIKRLGESSQEIGEITELIADITEQTNVLALNAAIQAASAGEAGRGFSVVAEKVQRLAERSADATRQISSLVKAIQTDTQDAVAAMERSTQGVVEGARLSDNAGAALSEIDNVSRHLAKLIERISATASQEAKQANEVAQNIQHIFKVTEQTEEGTRSTVAQVRDLTRMADELRQSVARFKIA